MVQNVGQFFCQGVCPEEFRWECRVNWTCGKEFFFCFETFFNWDVVDDIFLASVLDTHVTISERNLLIFEHLTSIVTSIHDIYLSQASDRSLSWRVNFSHDLEGFTCSEILICWDDTQYYRPLFRNVSEGHVFGDVVDIAWLLSNWDGSDSRQVDNGEGGAWLRVHIQHDGFVDDLLALPADLVSDSLDVQSYLVEVGKSLFDALFDHLVKLSIRCIKGWYMVHSQFKRSSGDNALIETMVTEPLGRKSSPTICSRRELFPDDWFPRTTTLGRDNRSPRPISLKRSTMDITFRRSLANKLPYITKLI